METTCRKYVIGNGRIDMDFRVLVLNPGSSTLKFALFRMPVDASTQRGTEIRLASGIIERLGTQQAGLQVHVPGQPSRDESMAGISLSDSLEQLTGILEEMLGSDWYLDAVGCRVVHGGDRFFEPTLVTPAVIEGIRALSMLAPLHNPLGADLLKSSLGLLAGTPTVAVFDTAFHRTLPEITRRYALPWELSERLGLQRYGFHGIAHRFVSESLLRGLEEADSDFRCITCHLGAGASVCAVRNGASIDTSMGLTPMEGLVMSTRSGDVDPGLILYLLKATGFSVEDVDDLLNNRSGMLGISGVSGDVRDLESAAKDGESRSELALEVFAYRVAKTVGAYAVALDGLDAVALSGGIGEYSVEMRGRICRRLRFLGLTLDDDLNSQTDNAGPRRISTEKSAVQAWVIPAEEDLQIARETFGLLRKRNAL